MLSIMQKRARVALLICCYFSSPSRAFFPPPPRERADFMDSLFPDFNLDESRFYVFVWNSLLLSGAAKEELVGAALETELYSKIYGHFGRLLY